MYELSTLKPPFNAFNLAGLIAKIKRATLPPIPGAYTPEWSNLVRRCRALVLWCAYLSVAGGVG